MARARQIPYVDPEASLFVHAAVAIGTRLDEVIAFEPCLSDGLAVYELHQMRIAAKRLRYTMDLFQSAFNDYSSHGEEFAAAIEVVKLLQERLGNLHDADVMAPKLTAQLRKLLAAGHGKDKQGEPLAGVHLVDFEACQGLITLCLETARKRDEEFDKLKSDWEQIRSDRLFDGWRKLLRQAITDETLAAALHEEASTGAGYVPEDAKSGTGARARRKRYSGDESNDTESPSRNGKAAASGRRRAGADAGA